MSGDRGAPVTGLGAKFREDAQVLLGMYREVDEATGLRLLSWSEARAALRRMGLELRDDRELAAIPEVPEQVFEVPEGYANLVDPWQGEDGRLYAVDQASGDTYVQVDGEDNVWDLVPDGELESEEGES